MKLVDPAYPWLPWIYRHGGDGFAPWVANWREYSAGGKTRLGALWHVFVYRLTHRLPDRIRWWLGA